MKKKFLKIVLVLLMAGLRTIATAQVTADEKRVMMQAFYWDCYNESGQGNWWDFIKPKMQSLSTKGITEIGLPVSHRATNNPSMGYDPYDYYDLGEFAQKVGPSSDMKTPTETYFGSRTELQNLITTMHSYGIKAYADMVFNHSTGGAMESNPNTGGQTATNFTPLSNKYSFHYNDFHPSTFESSDEGVFSTFPDICHTNPHVMTVFKAYQTWLINTIGYDGFRYDWVNGYHPWVIHDLQVNHGKFGVTEYWDQSKANCLAYLANTGNTTTTFDFPLFYALKDMCTNTGGGYDMRNLFSAGVVSSQPANAVTFVANHDTDKEAAYKIATEQKMMAYAFILTNQGLPMIFYSDYYNYGLAKSGTPNGIDQLIWVRKNLAAGAVNQLYADEDLFVMQRNGTPGLLMGINDNSNNTKSITVQTKWANTILKPYAWGSVSDSTTPSCIVTDANGAVTISVFKRGYVVYAPDNGSSPVPCSAMVASPVASPVAGTYTSTQTITLTSPTSGATIYYTTNGTVPTTTSTLYASPISVSSSATIRAIAVKSGMTNSTELSAAYTIGTESAVPSPWIRADVGSINPGGSATYNTSNASFTNKGAGADIYGTADAFGYVYQSVSGDVTITARVVSLTNTNDWAKAGVMIRESTNAGAANAFTAITPTNGITFQQRTVTGGTTTTTENGGLGAPYWVRVVRNGNNFSSYRSSDGATWTQVGSTATIAMVAQVLVGLAATSHANGTLGTAIFSNVVVTSAGGQAAAPIFSPGGGTYTGAQNVSLSSSTSGASIYYTTNGTTPTTSSSVYNSPVAVSSSLTLKAIAVKPGLTNSVVASAVFTINTTASGIQSGAIYKVIARHSGKALDVADVSTADGALVHQWDYVGGSNQKWKIESLAGGYYKLTATHSNKLLDVDGGSLDDNANVHQWSSAGVLSQQWSIVDVGSGYYKIVNRNSGKVLDVYGASTTNGGEVKQVAYGGGSNQQWSLVLLTAAGAREITPEIQMGEADAEGILLYPNPADKSMSIQVDYGFELERIIVMDTTGKIIHNQKTATPTSTVNTAAFAEGLYFVRLKGKKIQASKRFMIKH